MNIDITSFKNNSVNSIEIDETYSLNEEQLKKAKILELNNFKVKGVLINDEFDEYIIDVVINGNMKLQDSVTLEPVMYPFETEISGNIEELMEEIHETAKKSQLSIDIFPIIWENILMEIPIRVVSENRKDIDLQGDGWKFIQEEDYVSINPELEKLKDLLDEK